MAVPFQEKFKVVFGRPPTDKELQSLNRFVAQTDIKENDALLTFFLFEERNIERLESVPAGIEAASVAAEKSASERIDASIAAASQQAVPALVAAVDAQVAKISKAKMRKELTKWVSIAAGVAFVVVAGSVGVGYWLGSKEIAVAREASFLDGSKAAAWLTTPEARTAWKWAQDGTLGHFIRCDRPGWMRLKDGQCAPFETKNHEAYGWK